MPEDRQFSDEDLKEMLAKERAELPVFLPSFKYVVVKYQSKLYWFAMGIVKQQQDAEDVVQMAFINAYLALMTYTPERIRNLHLRALLYRITKNEAIKCSKKNIGRGQREISLEDLEPYELDQLMIHLSSQASSADEPSRRECFQSVFRQLNEQTQQALKLHFVAELKYEDVGKVLNLAEGSIKSIISRARAKLRKACPEYFKRG